MNRNVTGSIQPWDVGVLQGQGDRDIGNYHVRHVESQTLNFGTPLQTQLAGSEYLRIYEFYVGIDDVGEVLLEVDVDPGAAPLYALWLAEDFGTGDLLDYDAWATQDETDTIQLVVNIPDSGYNALVLYRDPKNGGGFGTLPITVHARPLPTDFAPEFAAGWYAPIVPRPADDGTFSSVPAPTALLGNVASTYLNWATKNLTSASGTEFYQARAYVDGTFLQGSGLPTVSPNQFFWTNSSTPVEVSGGRHSLAVLADALGNYAELSETNNGYGEQWVWSPKPMSLNSPLLRDQPTDRTGGWSEVSTGEPLWFNCDGLRTPVLAASGANGWWGAVATTPNGNSDVDLRLHELSTGVKDGFAEGLAFSGWGPGETDVVLVNFNQTAHRAFDVGVIDIAGSEGYVAHATSSFFLDSEPAGVYGTFGLPGGRLVSVHDLWLEPGALMIELVNVDGNIDYGMTLQRADLAFQDAATSVGDEAIAFLGGPGENESMLVDVPAAGSYALTVYKRTSADAMLQALYDLQFTTVTAVDEAPTTLATEIGSVYPNPFNPRTTISLRLQARGHVTLDLYNVRGERVRRLVDEVRNAGTHDIVWNGLDDAGASVASGTYVVRMKAGNRSDVRKITLLK